MEIQAPRHVAIIPDGNRRWARNRDLKPWKGHEAGAENTEKLVNKAFDLGIQYLSFWGSSVDNLTKRPIEEKKELLRIYNEYFQRMLKNEDIHKNQTKISVLGQWKKQFPESLQKTIHECVESTKQYSQYFLNFFLAYNGDDEMVEAIRSIVTNSPQQSQITKETVKENLFTKDLPSVDYLIRTGGEPHLSAGFMMWDIANAQLYFSKNNYPDFGPEAFEQAIEDFKRRSRRFGE